jgi:DNA-binding CsgD family transcriptional regulator
MQDVTRRQREVLDELEVGATNKEIAARLGCSVKTVEFHLDRLFDKFGVRTRAGLVGAALRASFTQQTLVET